MSILQPTPTTPQDIAQVKATQIIQNTARASKRLIRDWERSIDTLWDHENPQAILDAMGTDAAEVFALSSAVIQLMASILPASLPDEWTRIQAQKLSKIQQCTIHDDGSVSID